LTLREQSFRFKLPIIFFRAFPEYFIMIENIISHDTTQKSFKKHDLLITNQVFKNRAPSAAQLDRDTLITINAITTPGWYPLPKGDGHRYFAPDHVHSKLPNNSSEAYSIPQNGPSLAWKEFFFDKDGRTSSRLSRTTLLPGDLKFFLIDLTMTGRINEYSLPQGARSSVNMGQCLLHTEITRGNANLPNAAGTTKTASPLTMTSLSKFPKELGSFAAPDRFVSLATTNFRAWTLLRSAKASRKSAPKPRFLSRSLSQPDRTAITWQLMWSTRLCQKKL